jgi:AraC-like DNA-binding protein
LSKLNVRRLATLLQVSEQYQCTEMDRLIALALPMLDFSNLRISYSPFDPDYIDRPVASVRIEKGENDDELPTHRHRKGQLVLAEHGSVMCRTSDGLWIVPAQSAVWVPGGVPHSNCVSDNGCVYCVFIDPDSAQLPKSCCMFRISPLLRELISHLATLPPLYPLEGPTSRLVRVLLDELVQMPAEHHYLPVASNTRLRQIAGSLLKNPGDPSTISEWAVRYAMSERTLARLVVKQTGMTFGRWRQQLHVLIALRLLSAGSSVQTVSQDLGYESPSAFIAMFKKSLGKPPARYLADRARGIGS